MYLPDVADTFKLRGEDVKEMHKSKKIVSSESAWGIFFVSPLMIGISIFLLFPLIRSFWLSFTEYNLLEASRFIGLKNYIDLFTKDKMFMKSLVNTLVFTLGLVPANVALALLIAVLLNQIKKGAVLLRAIYFLPVITSEIVFSVVWLWIWNYDYGFINYLLDIVHISGPNWLGDTKWAMFSVIVTRVLKNLGMNTVIILASLQSISKSYYEAAELDGAGPIAKFINVTLPELSPVIFMTVMVTIIGSFKVFGTIYVLTGGGPVASTNVLVMYLYDVGFKNFEYGKASAIGVVIFGLVLFFTVVQWALRKKLVYQEN